MSNKLGTLTLDLVAKIGNFVEPMNQAEKKAKGTSQTIADSFNVSTLAINALGVAFAGVTVGGLTAFTNQIIDTGNEIKKLSQLSNTSTFDFQFYAKGAETAGISMESFADKMKDMQDRIGDFQQTGGGPLADFFTNIAPLVGVTIEQFQKLSGPEALQLFYNSLEKVGATQNDMKFYMESIISDSSLLIPLLENGGEGFKKWGQAASDAGAIMSSEMIEKLATAKENMQMLNLQVEGAQLNLINGLAPTVQTVANNLDVVAVAFGTVAVVMTAKATPAFVIGAIEATRYQLALARMSAQAAGTTTTLTVLGGVARGALGLLGGPVGLALTVAATAGAYLFFRDNTDKSTVSLRENNETVEQAIQKYTELGKLERKGQLVEEREKLEELTESYNDANSKLIAYALSTVRSSDMTSEQATAFSKLILDYKSGKITLEQLSDAVGKNTNFTQKQKDEFDKQVKSLSQASDKVKDQTKLIEQAIKIDKQHIKINDDVTNSIDRRGAALLKLTQKEREVYNSISQDLSRERYIQANVSQGIMSRDKAEFFADKRSDAGVAYNERLSKVMYSQIEASWRLAQNTEKRVEAEKKVSEQQKKQLENTKKMNETVGASALGGLRIKSGESVAGGGVKNYTAEFAKLTQEALGSDLNRFTAFNDLYHKGTNSKHATGNAFDFTVKNASEANKALSTLNKMAEKYGFTIKAINEYAKPSGRSTGGHIHVSVLGYKGNQDALANAKAEVQIVRDAQDEVEDLKQKSLERQKSVSQRYFDEEQKLSAENEEAKKEIQEAYAGNQDAINEHLKLQELSYQKDLKAFKKAQQEKAEAALIAYQTVLSEMQSIGMNATAMATLNPMEYQKWDLNNQQQAGYSQLADSFLLAQQAINENEVLAETKRYTELTLLHKTYLQNKAALAEQYAIEEQKLVQTQHESQMAIWQDLLTRTGTIFSQMAEMIKNTSGESSAAYKAMFLVNQGISIAQALINTEVAATKAMAEGGYIAGIPMSTAIRAMGYASVGVIAAQTVAGMAHDGIDSIPNEGTWLLDKGERVVDARTNADLKSYLESSNGSGGEQQSQPITIINQLEQDSLVGSYMRGAAGGRIFMNFIKENPSDVRAALGV